MELNSKRGKTQVINILHLIEKGDSESSLGHAHCAVKHILYNSVGTSFKTLFKMSPEVFEECLLRKVFLENSNRTKLSPASSAQVAEC